MKREKSEQTRRREGCGSERCLPQFIYWEDWPKLSCER